MRWTWSVRVATLFVAACAFALTACSSGAEPATPAPVTPAVTLVPTPAVRTTPTATASAASTPAVPVTSTATARPTIAATPAATATVAPSATPVARLTPTATPRPGNGGGVGASLSYIYSVKFVCGMLLPPGPKPSLSPLQSPSPVVPGVYRTAINVHNFMEQTVTITKKAVIALPEDKPRGAISRKIQDVLRDNEALEVDCQDVLKLLATVDVTVNPVTGFVTGFIEIQSPVELQVTAVYTMLEPLEQGVRIDVEQVSPHILNG